MRRFFVTPDAVSDEFIRITAPEDISHISKVLRMKVRDILDISDSVRWEYNCEIIEINDESIVLRILDKQSFAREPEINITLFQGVPKQGKMETIVQKNTELGVIEIVPVFMSRCVVTDNGKYDKKVKRYNTIAQEAAKQCKRGTIPEVLSAVDFNGMLKSLDGFDKVIFPYENEEKDTLKKVLKSFEGEDIRNIAVVIGPEGGFSDSEAQRLCESGALSASLGKTILRTETAGIVAVAMIMYEMEL